MNPRYKSNKKWTEFPADLTAGISDIFKQNFKTLFSDNTEVHVSGRFYEKEILVQVGLHKKGELRYSNFEVSLDHKNEPDKVIEQVYMAVDAIASLILEFFENGEEIELPYTWMEYPFNDQKVWLQFSTENPQLKDAADKLLGEANDSLIKEIDDEDSADILDATEDEFDEFAKNLEPQMFKKNKKEDMH
ncbi:MAG: hypothetical protein H7235_00075 [Bdellovibrionaceae bacterium]|nr:hypothetical protein [Pseudobdellovibrionaceae bacterium]